MFMSKPLMFNPQLVLQKNACNYVADEFPFRIHIVQTNNGHEFHSRFWHIEDIGMKHSYMKAGRLQFNGKVERSHLTDKKGFYQLLDYSDDLDLNKKIKFWCRLNSRSTKRNFIPYL